MASAKRAREEGAGDAAPLVDRKAIKAQIGAAKKALDAPRLRHILKELEETSSWLKGTRIKLEDSVEYVEEECKHIADCAALEAKAKALPPGGAVATFDKVVVDDLFKGPLGGDDDETEDKRLFMRTSFEVTVTGIPVKVKSFLANKFDVLRDTYKELIFPDDTIPKTGAFEAVLIAAKEAVAALVNRTPMREVIRFGDGPDFQDEDLWKEEHLVEVDVRAHVIFARPKDGWPFVPPATSS